MNVPLTLNSSSNKREKELAELYTPTSEELKFINAKSHGSNGRLSLLVMLKTFQRLGYFPYPEFVPLLIINHLRSGLKLSSKVSAIPSLRSRRRYMSVIRTYLGVKP